MNGHPERDTSDLSLSASALSKIMLRRCEQDFKRAAEACRNLAEALDRIDEIREQFGKVATGGIAEAG